MKTNQDNNNTLNQIEKQNQLSKTYFDLIKKVGQDHKYQFRIFLLLSIGWLLIGYIYYSPALIFQRRQFDCQKYGFSTDQCQTQLCELDHDNIQKYLKPIDIYSAAQEFGPFYCQKSHIVIALRICPYLGGLFSFIFAILTDNIGRKASINIIMPITILGIVLILASANIWMVGIGLFFSGIGAYTIQRLTGVILIQICNKQKQQIYIVLTSLINRIQVVLVGIFFNYIKNWKISVIVFLFIPSLFITIFFIIWFYETPKFLINNHTSEQSAQIMNKIGQINGFGNNQITVQDIQSVKKHSKSQQKKTYIYTPIDLYRYPSLRLYSLIMPFAYFCLSYLHLGPFNIIDYIGINAQINEMAFGIAGIIATLVSYKIITKVPRKLAIQTIFGVHLVLLILSVLIKRDQNNNYSLGNTINLILYFIGRNFIFFFFSLIIVYLNQLYPLSVRGIGTGVSTLASSFAQISCIIVLLELLKTKFHPVYFLIVMNSLGFLLSFFLIQTLNRPLRDQIQQIDAKLKLEQHQTK